jgi:hypothetical protein
MKAVVVTIVGLLYIPTVHTQATTCPADPTCNEHRVCEFGSLAAYDVVRQVIFNMSGCSEACIDQCTCTCGPGGIVHDELAAVPPAYCTRSPEVCANPLVQRAMNYDAVGYTCESVFIIAMEPIYQLCATIKHECANGACNASYCANSVAPICEQAVGIPRSIQFAMAAYTMVAFVVWQLAMAMAYYYRDNRGVDFVTSPDDSSATTTTTSAPLYQKPTTTPRRRQQQKPTERSSASFADTAM